MLPNDLPLSRERRAPYYRTGHWRTRRSAGCSGLLGGWQNGVKERTPIRALIAKLRHKGSAVTMVNCGAASLVP